jgi:hypothetical protein
MSQLEPEDPRKLPSSLERVLQRRQSLSTLTLFVSGSEIQLDTSFIPFAVFFFLLLLFELKILIHLD